MRATRWLWLAEGALAVAAAAATWWAVRGRGVPLIDRELPGLTIGLPAGSVDDETGSKSNDRGNVATAIPGELAVAVGWSRGAPPLPDDLDAIRALIGADHDDRLALAQGFGQPVGVDAHTYAITLAPGPGAGPDGEGRLTVFACGPWTYTILTAGDGARAQHAWITRSVRCHPPFDSGPSGPRSR